MCTLKRPLEYLKHVLGVCVKGDGDMGVCSANLAYHAQGLCSSVQLSLNVGARLRYLKVTDRRLLNRSVGAEYNHSCASDACFDCWGALPSEKPLIHLQNCLPLGYDKQC